MPEKKQRLISKGRYVDGVKCVKLLWYRMNDKSVFPPIDAATQLLFDQGHEVGRIAHKLYKDAIEIEWNFDAEKVTQRSAEAVKTGKTIFEAGFAKDGTYSIADILDPVKGKKGTYDLIEVKMGGSVKEYYYDDVAFQKYNYEKFGLKIRNCYLKVVDTKYVYRGGEIDPGQFFQPNINIYEEVEARLPEVAANVKRFHEVISKRTPPEVKLSLNCEDGSECDLLPMCTKDISKGSVFTLHGMNRKKKFDYYFEQGKKLILDITREELSDKHAVMHDALRTKEAQWDREEIAGFLRALKYPIYFLDFETLTNIAVPKFVNTRPYQQIPFQFSLHIQKTKGGKVLHHMFLAEGTDDPRPRFITELDKHLGNAGTILTFNSQFEKGRIDELAVDFPEFRVRADAIIARIEDLQTPFKRFHYYSHEQEGSASLKKVLPAMTGIGYDDMEIGDGATAGAEFIKITYGKASDEERQKVRKALIEYCTQDTHGMVDILEKLESEARR